ncbi:MAG: molybdate ABC transporter substrate-binding protein, partial [Peptostreptococcaceae bacterium]
MKKNIVIMGLILSMVFSVIGCSNSNKDGGTAETVELNISAAASLKEAMAELEEEYKKSNENITLVVNFGASGSLQQQIEQGAPCDLFIS